MIVLVLALCACGAEPGTEQASRPTASSAAPAPAEPASAAPAPQAAEAAAGLLPPDVRVTDGGAGSGETALSFSSAAPPTRLLQWYRSPARRRHFTLQSELQEGAEQVLSGFTPRRRDFTVRLAPGSDGGTEAMLLITGR